jgi:hypothetical protein
MKKTALALMTNGEVMVSQIKNQLLEIRIVIRGKQDEYARWTNHIVYFDVPICKFP